MGRSLGWFWFLLLLVVSCGGGDQHDRVTRIAQGIDTVLPTWPYASSLSVTLRTPTRIGLEWPAATDDVGVAGYRVYRDSVLAVTLGPEQRSWISAGHLPLQTITFTVQAFDAAGNVTAGGYMGAVPTTEGPSSAPVWSSSPALSLVELGKRQVRLSWSAATDDYAELTFEVTATTGGVRMPLAIFEGTSGSNVLEWTSPAMLAPGTAYDFEVDARDYEGNHAATVLEVSGTTRAISAAPLWATGSVLTGAREAWSALSATGSTRSLDVDHYVFTRRPSAGPWLPWTEVPFPFASGNDFHPGRTWELRAEIVDQDGLHSTPLETSVVMPAPTLGTPPTLDATQASDTMDRMSFLFTGSDPAQAGVDVPHLIRDRLALLRGRLVRRSDGTGLAGVRVHAPRDQALGETYTRADGRFDMVVHGGEPVVVSFALVGMLPVERTIPVPPGEVIELGDVALIPASATTTAITFDSSWHTAEGEPVTEDGYVRRPIVMVPPGTTATMLMRDHSEVALPTGTLRMTEYTVGPRGPQAMPGSFPANIAYTWAAEFSFDEAVAADARGVAFNQPVPIYVDNFLHFPVGAAVPSGWYDPEETTWHGNEEGNGIVLGVLDAQDSAGGALLDLNNDTVHDAADETLEGVQGIALAERIELRRLYPGGRELWRFRVRHFSTWDANWGIWPPPDAKEAYLREVHAHQAPENVTVCTGSVIECQNRTLGESIPLPGTPFTLHHWSDRTVGRQNVLDLDVGDPGPGVNGLPASLRAIRVEVHFPSGVVGGRIAGTASSLLHHHAQYTWNGLDAFGRPIQGSVRVQVRVGYEYRGQYAPVERFGYNGNGVPITVDETRENLILWKVVEASVGGWSHQAEGLGGWTLDGHAAYDPSSGTVHYGNGEDRSGESMGARMRHVAGGGASVDDGPVAGAMIQVRDVAVARDGSIWFSELNRVRRLTPGGLVETMVGTGTSGCGADGTGTTSAVAGVENIAAVADVIVISERGCHRVRYVDSDGNVQTLLGTGTQGYNGDGLTGDLTQLSYPEAVRFQGDALYVADSGNDRIRRMGLTDMVVRTVAGGGNPLLPVVEGGVATEQALRSPRGLDVTADGAMLIADDGHNRVFRVGPDGRMRTFAGSGTAGSEGDGGAALAAQLDGPWKVLARPDGSVVIASLGDHLVRVVDPGGRIATLVGHVGALFGEATWGRPGTETRLNSYPSFAQAPDGTLLVGGVLIGNGAQIGRLDRAMPGFQDGDVLIPSADGGAIDVFRGRSGCHMRTVDALTLRPRLTFEYESVGSCRLSAVVMGEVTTATPVENRVVIHRVSANDVRVRGPFYQASVSEEEVRLQMDSAGHLASVTHGTDVWGVTHGTTGLLTRLEDPLGHEHLYEYSAAGLLERDVGPAGTVTRLTTDAETASNTFLVRRVLGLTGATAPEVTHRVSWLPGAARQYEDDSPGGNATTRVRRATLVSGLVTASTVSSRDGGDPAVVLSSQVENRASDPRLGAGATRPGSVTRVTAGRTVRTSLERAVTTVSAGSLVVATQEDQRFVNDEPSPRVTTRYDAAHSDCGGHGRVEETTRGGRVVRTCLDADGRVASVQARGASPALHPVVFHYDARGRMDYATQGTRRVVSTWRTDGRPDTTSVGTVTGGVFTALQTTSTAYDATTRRPVSQSLPGSRTVGVSVDAMGRTGSLTPPGRTAHTMGYDEEGRMEAFTSPAPDSSGDPLVLDWSYNGRRQLTRHTRADGAFVDLAYDDGATGHLDTVTFPVLGAVTYGYRPATGAGATVHDPSGCKLRTVYEEETLPVGVVLEAVPGGACPVLGSVSRTVNELFETTAVTVGGGPAVSITLDTDADRLVTAVGGMTLGRDGATGRLTGTLIGEVETEVAYTAYGEPASVGSEVGGVTELGLAYAYDGLGRMGTVTETGHIGRATTYGYDSAGRLETVSRGGSTVESYAYAGSDGSNGNRTGWTNALGTFTATYDAQDRLNTSTLTGGATTAYGYDDHGSMTTRTTSGLTTTYAWDPRGPLASVTRPGGAPVISYVLDPQGRRIGRKVGGTLERGWLYSGGLHPVAEMDADGTTVRRVFVYATRGHSPDLVMQREGGNWVTYRVLSDHLGSVRAVVKTSDGTVMQRMDYDAFGRVADDWVASGWVPVPFGYAGGLYDRDTGLVRFGAREYDAGVGRWVSRDPLLFSGGDINFYGYCFGNPTNLIDSNGLWAWGPIIAGGVWGGVSSVFSQYISTGSINWVDVGTATAVGALAGAAVMASGFMTAANTFGPVGKGLLMSLFGADQAIATTLMTPVVRNGVHELAPSFTSAHPGVTRRDLVCSIVGGAVGGALGGTVADDALRAGGGGLSADVAASFSMSNIFQNAAGNFGGAVASTAALNAHYDAEGLLSR